jgi:hypothetical protein
MSCMSIRDRELCFLRTMCYVMNDIMKYFISHVFHLQTNNGLFSFYVVHDSIMFPAFHKSLFFMEEAQITFILRNTIP